MIKGINQSMVNRSIAGGGVSCKCINSNGISGESNGNEDNGGKIEVEFTIYEVEGSDETYIMQEDAERVFNEIVDVDLEKYVFYSLSATFNETFENQITLHQYTGPCLIHITTTMIPGSSKVQTVGLENDIIAVSFATLNDVIQYDGTLGNFLKLGDAKITSDPISTTDSSIPYKLTLYYRER